MLKKITLGYSIVYVIIFIICIGELVFNDGSSYLSTYSLTSSSLLSNNTFMLEFIKANTVGFITIVISSLMLHKSEDSFFPKVAIWVALINVPVFIISYYLTQNINTLSSFFKDYLIPAVNFIYSAVSLSYLYVIPILLTLAIIPENFISEKIRKINLFVIVANLLCGLILLVLLNSVSNTTSYETIKSVLSTISIVLKIYVVTFAIEFILICIGHILNYVFMVNSDPEKEKVVEELDYEELSRLARENIQAKEQALYGNIQASINNEATVNNVQTNVASPIVEEKPAPVEQEQLTIPVQAQPVKAPVQEDLKIPVQSQPVLSPTQQEEQVVEQTVVQEVQEPNETN